MAEQTWTHDDGVKVNCKDCSATCCKHIAIPIDEPLTPADFARIRWWVSHDDIMVYKDVEDDWIVEFVTKCGNLEGNRCTVYASKKYPRICGDYDMKTCVMNEEGDYWSILFKTPEDVDSHCRTHGIALVTHDEQLDCVTVALDAPEDASDFDDLWWYVSHRDVTVYRKAGAWFLHCNTTCKLSCSRKHAQFPRDADVVFKTWEAIIQYCKQHGIIDEKKGSDALVLSSV